MGFPVAVRRMTGLREREGKELLEGGEEKRIFIVSFT